VINTTLTSGVTSLFTLLLGFGDRYSWLEIFLISNTRNERFLRRLKAPESFQVRYFTRQESFQRTTPSRLYELEKDNFLFIEVVHTILTYISPQVMLLS